MKKWIYLVVSLLYVLPVFLWDSFFDRISSPGLTYFWAFLVVVGAINVFYHGKMNVVKSGAVSSIIAGMLIGVTVGAANWTPVNFSLIREFVYLLAPLFMLYLPIERMLKRNQEGNELSSLKNEGDRMIY
ncbi:hypothetical protein M4S82_15685 [Planococcus sp. MERTA32b]|nr:hypothetical protein [Planococcus sp. MER TA 32b]